VTVTQAVEAAKLFARHHDHKRVGWELWWGGFDIDERYWRPLVTKQSAIVRKSLAIVARFLARADDDEALADEIYGSHIPRQALPTPLRGASRNLSDEKFTEAVWRLVHASTGRFEGFDDDVTSGADDRDSVLKLLGLHRSLSDSILGVRFDFPAGFDQALRAMSAAPPPTAVRLFSPSGLARLTAARDDVHNAFETVAALHEAVAWIYGPRAFGLKLGSWIARNAPPIMRAGLIVSWMQLRESSPDSLLSPAEVAELRRQAVELLDMSRQLRCLIEWDRSLQPFMTPKRLRRALSTREALARFEREVAFRPAM
jgi:hypothetical protein